MTDLPKTMPMTWSEKADRPNDTDYCVCCDRPVVPARRHTVEVSGDMGDALRPGVPVDELDSGGCFTVGPDCARKYLAGFTTHTGAT